jgi:hypothetical protein
MWNRYFPGLVLLGYLAALLIATGSCMVWPSSSVSLGFLALVVGAFLLVAMTIAIAVWLMLAVSFLRAVREIPRALLVRFRASSWKTDVGLWDRWLDGIDK